LNIMSLGDRLGIAGLISACIGIGVAILWPTVRWIGWTALISALVLVICWTILEFGRPREVPSLVFVFGAPLGDNGSPVWIMMLKHFGPKAAHNCDIQFFDADRKSIERAWLLQHPSSPFPPPNLVGKSQERLRVDEAGPEASAGGFQWIPLDPDRQHYTASISCRDGLFVQSWDVTRVNGILRTRIKIERGPLWIAKNPKRDPVVFECTDPEFVETALATVVPAVNARPVHPGWKPNHVFQFPVAIIDPNKQVQVISGIKQPDGTMKTDFGCWNALTMHFGDKRTR
jgi:hypothetical protein